MDINDENNKESKEEIVDEVINLKEKENNKKENNKEEDEREESKEERHIKNKMEFFNVLKDFIKDIELVYPEIELNKNLLDIKENNDYLKVDDSVEVLFNYCKDKYPEYFFKILYENEDIFSEDIMLLPEINFRYMWFECEYQSIQKV